MLILLALQFRGPMPLLRALSAGALQEWLTPGHAGQIEGYRGASPHEPQSGPHVYIRSAT